MPIQELPRDSTSEAAPEPGILEEVRVAWGQLPDKWMFLALLAAWLLLFQFFGNSTLGYIHSASLLSWMQTAYTLKSSMADDSHGALIPLVVLGILWWKRAELQTIRLRSWWPGLLLLAAALLLHLVGYAVQQPRVSILALLGGVYALTGLVWGPACMRATIFPFFLFVFMVPLGSLTEPVTFPLRLLVVKSVAFICQHLLGMDVVCNGTQLFNGLRTYQYDVAPACSGIRSLIAITAIAIVYAFMVFRGIGPRLMIMASALPLAVIGNTFRMLVIVLAAEFWGQRAGNWTHENWFFSLLPYVPAILGLLLLGQWLERFEGANGSVDPATDTTLKTG